MDATNLSNVLASIFAELPRKYEDVRYSLEGDSKFKPPHSVVRKVLTDYAREAGKGSSSYLIQKAFDEEPDFVRDLAVTVAASYSRARG